MTTQKAVSTTTPKTASEASATGRKTWIKKTPVDIVLEQIGKQEKKVAGMRQELTRAERELSKLQQAKKVLEAQ